MAPGENPEPAAGPGRAASAKVQQSRRFSARGQSRGPAAVPGPAPRTIRRASGLPPFSRPSAEAR